MSKEKRYTRLHDTYIEITSKKSVSCVGIPEFPHTKSDFQAEQVGGCFLPCLSVFSSDMYLYCGVWLQQRHLKLVTYIFYLYSWTLSIKTLLKYIFCKFHNILYDRSICYTKIGAYNIKFYTLNLFHYNSEKPTQNLTEYYNEMVLNTMRRIPCTFAA